MHSSAVVAEQVLLLIVIVIHLGSTYPSPSPLKCSLSFTEFNIFYIN